MKEVNVAVVGATGAVGNEMVKILEERRFPINELKLLASKRSLGKKMGFNGKEVAIEELTEDAFTDVQQGGQLFSFFRLCCCSGTRDTAGRHPGGSGNSAP